MSMRDVDRSKKQLPPPPTPPPHTHTTHTHHEINNPLNLLAKTNEKLCFLRLYTDQVLREVYVWMGSTVKSK